jgi:hypothetical protein
MSGEHREWCPVPLDELYYSGFRLYSNNKHKIPRIDVHSISKGSMLAALADGWVEGIDEEDEEAAKEEDKDTERFEDAFGKERVQIRNQGTYKVRGDSHAEFLPKLCGARLAMTMIKSMYMYVQHCR